MKLSACGRLALDPLTGTWYRALGLRFWKNRLATDHSRTSPTRFSAGGPSNPLYKILYLAANHQVTLFEVGALLDLPNAPVPNPQGVWTIMPLNVRLQLVADLTRPAEQKLIQTNAQELTGNWLYHHAGPAPTQLLGAALYQVPRLEAFLTPSARAGGANLVIFPEKLQPGSRVEFRNPQTGKVERLKP